MVAGDVDDPDASWAQRGFRRPCLGHTDSVDCHAHPVLQFEQFIEGLAVGGISSADEGGAFQIPDVVANVVGYGGSEVAIDPARFHHEGVEGRLIPDDLGDRGEHPGSSETGPETGASSKTVTSIPRRRSRQAVVRPIIPAPAMTTEEGRPRSDGGIVEVSAA